MKVKNSLRSLKSRHRDCRIVRRKGRVYVINKTQRRFKARQGWAGPLSDALPEGRAQGRGLPHLVSLRSALGSEPCTKAQGSEPLAAAPSPTPSPGRGFRGP